MHRPFVQAFLPQMPSGKHINGPSMVSTHTHMHTWTHTLHFDTESKTRATNIISHYCQGYLLNAEHLREVSFCSMKASNKYMLSADIMYSAILGGRDKMLSELERPALRWQSSGAKYLDRPLLRYYYYCCCLSFEFKQHDQTHVSRTIVPVQKRKTMMVQCVALCRKQRQHFCRGFF